MFQKSPVMLTLFQNFSLTCHPEGATLLNLSTMKTSFVRSTMEFDFWILTIRSLNIIERNEKLFFNTYTRRQNFSLIQIGTNCRRHFKVNIGKKNIVRRGEIACYKQFLLLSQCFPQLYIFSASKCGIVW